MTTVSVADFFQTLGDLRLLRPEQLKELTRGSPASPPEPRAIAKELIQRGWLTPYQVRELFQGRGEDLILGRYVLLEPLGEGGMGRVYKARHRELDRLVAVKILREERLTRRDAVRRFHREIQAAAQLSHPNIALVYDANRVGKRIFFVMEYIDGIDLHQLVKQSGPLPVALACEYIRQAALGLQHALERGLVHRDIKPANLLVTFPRGADGSQGQVVKILDLGLASAERAREGDTADSHLTKEGMVLGTVDYVAPEQAKDSHQVDIRADLYSLGCTFYYLLTGRPPFPEGAAIEKLLKHQTQAPVPMAFLRPDVPPEIGAVVAKLLCKRPEDRHQTPAELAEALTSARTAASGSPGSWSMRESAFEQFSLTDDDRTAGFEPELSLSTTPVTPDTIQSVGGWTDLPSTPLAIETRGSGRRNKKLWKKEHLWLAAVLALVFVVGLIVLIDLSLESPNARDNDHRPIKLKKTPEKRPRSSEGRSRKVSAAICAVASFEPGRQALP